MKQPYLSVLGVVCALVNACAPGKATMGGVGCSKTTSIMKVPQIRDITLLETRAPTEKEQRERVIKLFGTENPMFTSGSSMFAQSSTGGLKSAGGYIYVQTRNSGDPLGPTKDKYSRCSVLVEFPKNTGEMLPPNSAAGSNKFPNTLAAIEAHRFPSTSDPISNIRIYTAAHCLDYSVNESVILSLFKEVVDGELPSPGLAYLDLGIKIPELEAVKELRNEIKTKISQEKISREEGEQILNAFRPMARNLDKIFGSNDSASHRGRCNFKPSAVTSSTEQYSCATYHDLAVLDLQLDETLTQSKLFELKAIRDKWVTDLKAEEAKGPWVEYVKPPFDGSLFNQTRFFIDSVLSESVDPTLKTDAAKTDPSGQCLAFPDYKILQSCVDIAPVSATSTISAIPPDYLYPGHPGSPEIPGNPGSPGMICPRLSSRLGLFRPTPNNCLEVPLTSAENLHFVRYITRERLRAFSRYNMATHVNELMLNPLNLQSCTTSAVSEGVCSLKAAINTALNGIVTGMGISTLSAFQANYQNATDYVDASLSVWNPFFAVAKNMNANIGEADAPAGASFNTDFLKEVINPIDFLKLHSNVIILDEAVSEANYPSAQDDVMHRAFMMMPMHSVIGWSSFQDSLDPNPTLPIGIDDWSATDAGSGKGKFLRLLVKNVKLDELFRDFLEDADEGAFPGAPTAPSVPMSAIFIDPATASLPFPLPTKVFLQKGDSGSIFTLDSVPAFALSTVNGEATSGGAAVRSVPPDLADEGVPIRVVGRGSGGAGPGGSGPGGGGGGTSTAGTNGGGSGDGPGAAAGSGGTPVGGTVASVATCK